MFSFFLPNTCCKSNVSFFQFSRRCWIVKDRGQRFHPAESDHFQGGRGVQRHSRHTRQDLHGHLRPGSGYRMGPLCIWRCCRGKLYNYYSRRKCLKYNLRNTNLNTWGDAPKMTANFKKLKWHKSMLEKIAGIQHCWCSSPRYHREKYYARYFGLWFTV